MFLKLILSVRERWASANISIFGADALLGVFAESDNRAIEGQREIAVVHNLEAVREIFPSLELKYHDSISSMAGGQSVSIFEKRRDKNQSYLPENVAALSKVDGELSADRRDSDVQRFLFAAT